MWIRIGKSAPLNTDNVMSYKRVGTRKLKFIGVRDIVWEFENEKIREKVYRVLDLLLEVKDIA